MSSRAILVNFRNYTGFGSEFYKPLLDFFLTSMVKYMDEFDTLYLLDSNWGIEAVPDFAKVIKVDPSLSYSDSYKYALPFVAEELVLLLDNDTIIYKKGVIDAAFKKLEEEELDK